MTIVYTASAKKDLRGIAAKTALRIRNKIRQLETDPRAVDVLKLQGAPGFRLRVGAFRVLFLRDGDTVTVRAVAPRGKAYR